MNRLGVIIVNYRTAELTLDCLRSLEPQIRALQGRVVVTDNASGDDSIPRLEKAARDNHWRQWLTILPLPRNGGFAYGNNAGIKALLDSPDKPNYLLLLNPDTIVRDGALHALLHFMDENPSAGIAGSRLENPDGSPQTAAFRFHSIFSELDSGLRLGVVSGMLARWRVALPIPDDDRPRRVDWVSGASFLIRRSTLEQIGLLDESYFMYFEEVDLCLRARRSGWECWHVPASRVVHLVGQASGINQPALPPRRRPAYWFDSRRRYFVKNHGRFYAALADLAWAGGFALWRIRRAIQRRRDTDPPRLLGDFLRHSILFRGSGT